MPQPQAYYGDGKPIPDDDLKRALDAGEAHYDPDAKISVVAADGKTWQVPATELDQARAKGFQVESRAGAAQREADLTAQQERRSNVFNPLKVARAIYEGQLAGQTFGATDWIAKQLGADPQAMAARRNTLAGTIGEFGGQAELAAAPEAAAGVGAAGLLGGGLTSGLASGSRLGQAAINTGRAVTEGFYMGAQHEASQEILNDRQLAADQIALSGLHAALWAGGGTVAVEGLGALGNALGGTIAQSGIASRAADDLTTRGALSALGATKAQASHIRDPEAFAQTVSNYVIREGKDAGQPLIPAFRDTDTLLPRLQQATREAGKDVDALGQAISADMAAHAEQPNYDKIMNAIREGATRGVDPMVPSAQRGLRLALKEFGPIAERAELAELRISKRAMEAAGVEADPAIVARIGMLEAKGVAKPMTFNDLLQVRREIDDRIYREKPHAGVPAPPTHGPLKGANDAFRREISDLGEQKLAQLGLDPGAWRKANETFGHLRDARNMADKAVSGEYGGRFTNQRDRLVGLLAFWHGLATGSFRAMAEGAAAVTGSKLLHAYGGSTLVAAVRKMRQMNRQGETLAKEIVSGAISKQSKRAIGQLPAALERRHEDQQAHLQTGLAVSKQDRADFIRIVKNLSALEDPAIRTARVGAAIGPLTADGANNLAHTAALNLHAGVEYLISKLPKPMQDLSMQPQKDKISLPDKDIRDFLDTVKMLTDPISAIRASLKGDLDPAAIDALRELHPAYYQDLRMKIATEVSKQEKVLPFARRTRIALDWDLPEPSLDPAYLIQTQQSFAAHGNLPKSPGAPPLRPMKPQPKTILDSLEARQ